MATQKVQTHQKSIWRQRLIRFGFIGAFAIGAFYLGASAITQMEAKTAPLWLRHAKFLVQSLWKDGAPSKIFDIYAHAWARVQYKADILRSSEEENARLRLENAQLKLAQETIRHSCQVQGGLDVTKKFELKLTQETGTKAGRVLASIDYRPPSQLAPPQLYTLGVSYMKAHENEKAAVIFTILTGLDDTDTFKTPKNFLVTGVLWYHLDNLNLADSYFDEVLKKPEHPEILQFQAQARLWKALVAKRTSKETKSQFWLKELVDHHPQSLEAEWVNPGGEHEKSHQE